MFHRLSTSVVLLTVVALTACSSGDDGTTDGGACIPAECVAQCQAAGRPNGECIGGMCQCTGTNPDADADADPDVGADGDADVGPDEAEAVEDDGGPEDAEEIEVDPCAPASCLPSESCGETTFGDGIDNDCDTEVDEGCTCGGVGTTLECFPGDPAICPAGQPCSGGCTRGVETCTEFLIWSGCEDAVEPQDERCDGLDNDCDTLFDEGIPGCDSPVICPSTVRAAPMNWVALDGGSIFPGSYDSWSWQVFCPVTVDPCPAPEEPTMRDTQVFLISSGTYRARATIEVGPDTYTCEFAIVTQGEGLRVELNWDTRGSGFGDTDVDLHLHKWGATSEFCTDDDCYFSNCKASSGPLDWGLASTADLDACRNAPHGEGARWVTLGSCANPRLDVDVITCTPSVTDPTSSSFCAPENINIDNPPLYEPVRVMVNYWSSHSYSGTTNASINIYCGGGLRATFGPEPLTTSGACAGQNWLVADVMFYEGPCGTLDCEIVPLETVQMGAAFGPPWSTFTHAP
jgi:hypothetical protein